MTVQALTERLGLTPLCLPDPYREIEGGYTGDLLSWVMGNARSGDAWITIMSNQNIIAVATLADTACIILTEGVQPDPGVLELAEKKDINLLTTQASSFAIGAKVAACL